MDGPSRGAGATVTPRTASVYQAAAAANAAAPSQATMLAASARLAAGARPVICVSISSSFRLPAADRAHAGNRIGRGRCCRSPSAALRIVSTTYRYQLLPGAFLITWRSIPSSPSARMAAGRQT